MLFLEHILVYSTTLEMSYNVNKIGKRNAESPLWLIQSMLSTMIINCSWCVADDF